MTEFFDLFNPADITAENVSLTVDLDDWFFMRTLQMRVIEVPGIIESGIVSLCQRAIIQINQMDKDIPIEDRVPIKLLISSDGGDTFAGLELIDMIQNSKTPVWTINMGHEYSMAAIVGLAGHKRYAAKNASFLIHDGAVSINDSGSKVHDFIKFDIQLNERIKKFVLSKSEITARMYNSKARNEWYFFAEEAKKLGMIDGIIGEDIEFEEII